MKLVLDEHFSARVAVQLRNRSHDVVAVSEVPKLRGSSDEDLLGWAQAEGRILVTHDVADFLTIDARMAHDGEHHHGIVLVSHRRFPADTAGIGSLVAALHAFLNSGAGDDAGHGQVRWL